MGLKQSLRRWIDMSSYRLHLLAADSITDSNDLLNYNTNKYITIEEIHNLRNLRLNDSEFYISAHKTANDRYSLTLCIYKGDYYIGIFDKISCKLDFDDTTGCLRDVYPGTWEKLLLRALNAANGVIKTASYNTKIDNAWRDALPLLHAVSLYKDYVSEYEPNSLTNGECYDVLNSLVAVYYELRDSGVSMDGLYLSIANKVPSFKKAYELSLQTSDKIDNLLKDDMLDDLDNDDFDPAD